MRKRLQPTNIPGLVKDNATGAVINTDIEGYKAYKLAREKRIKSLERVDKLEMEVVSLKNTIKTQNGTLEEMSSMLKILVDNHGR